MEMEEEKSRMAQELEETRRAALRVNALLDESRFEVISASVMDVSSVPQAVLHVRGLSSTKFVVDDEPLMKRMVAALKKKIGSKKSSKK